MPKKPVVDSSGGFVEASARSIRGGVWISRFAGLFAGEARRRIARSPSYPFQRAHHWVQTSKRRRRGRPAILCSVFGMSRPAVR